MWSARMTDLARRALGEGVGLCFIDAVTPTPPLHPEERAWLSPTVNAKRRRDFEVGRAAARGALRAAGGPWDQPIAKDLHGAPGWPSGWRGAITHSAGHGGAVASREAAALGLDLERLDRPLSPGAQRIICRPEEGAWIEGAGWRTRLISLFSAKESIFKAIFPLEAVFLDYADAGLQPIEWDELGRICAFEARLYRQGARGYPEGARLRVFARYLDDFVLTGVRL
ncbi:4'-phosphopantetheinyl transferase superfamily protein [Myxococcota bacterium]|nr:4'-phosphopantetheinyl transferase superfamily protein [Myxococcota bacterium]